MSVKTKELLYCIGVKCKNDEASIVMKHSVYVTFYATELKCDGRHQPGQEVRVRHRASPQHQEAHEGSPKYKVEKEYDYKYVAVSHELTRKFLRFCKILKLIQSSLHFSFLFPLQISLHIYEYTVHTHSG